MSIIKSILKNDNENTIRLVLGQLISVFGTQIYTFALSYYILKMTGSGVYFGISLAFGMLPQFLFSPVAGVICDKISRKRILVYTDILSGFLLIGVLLVSLITDFKIIYIYILMFTLASLNTFNNVSLNAAIPSAVHESKVANLNASIQSASSLARITAPFIGGILILSINMLFFIFVNGLSFLIAAWLEKGVIFKENEMKKDTDILKSNFSFLKDFHKGWNYCRDSKVIFTIIVFMFAMNFLFHFAFTVPIPYIINNTLLFDSSQFGIIQGMTSGGAFFTSAFLMNKLKRMEMQKVLIISIFMMAFLLMCMGVVTYLAKKNSYEIVIFIVFVVLNFMFGGSIVTSNISIITILQIKSDSAFRGRVMGITNMTKSVISPVAVLLSGAMIDSISSYILPLVGGALLLISVTILGHKEEIKEFGIVN